MIFAYDEEAGKLPEGVEPLSFNEGHAARLLRLTEHNKQVAELAVRNYERLLEEIKREAVTE